MKLNYIFFTLFILMGASTGICPINKKDSASIVATINALEYHIRNAKNSDSTFQITNRKNNIRAEIHDQSFNITSRDQKQNWEIQYKLLSIKHDNKKYNLTHLKAQKNKNTLSLFNDDLSINYHNSEKGLRQDFIVNNKNHSSNDQLELKLEVQSPFNLKVFPDKLLHQKNNKTIVAYENLKVFDANHKVLNAKFTLNKNVLAINVDTKNAIFPITIDPLTTTPDWNAEQNQANAAFGYSLAYVGDVNNDGFGDLLVGAPFFDNGFTDEGRAFLYFGSSAGLAATAGWAYSCGKTNCQLGYSVDTAGDVNNDGIKDFIIGAPYYTNGQTEEGAAFIFHGKATAPLTTPTTILESNLAGVHFGSSVAGGAKFNNDLFSDIAIGAPHYTNIHSNQGVVFVYWGSAAGISSVVKNTITTNAANAQLGQVVKVLSDVNGDGFSDLIASAPAQSEGNTNEGKVYLYLGSAGGLSSVESWTAQINLDNANFGETIASGDINHDGNADLIVGAPRYTDSITGNTVGAIFVYYGNGTSFGATPNVTFKGNNDWEYFGGGLLCADINGDSFAEIIVSSIYFDGTFTDEGKVYVYYGTSYGIETTPSWSKLGGSSEATFGLGMAVGDVNKDNTPDLFLSGGWETNGQTYEGKVYAFHGSLRGLNTGYTLRFNYPQASSQFGYAIANAGDVNGDGYDDLIVGAYNYDNGQTNEGAAFLFLGSSTGISNTTPAWIFESNQASAQLGFSVAGNCDFNKDGYKDVIIGANLFDNVQTNEGRVFVFYGSASGLPTTASWTAEPNVASAQFGYAVACVGDINNDTYDDLLVGAPNLKTTLNNEGKAFLYKGSSTGLAATAAWSYVGGLASANFGKSVSGAMDINNDGFKDIMVGAPAYKNTLTGEGAVFIFKGSSTVPQTTPTWSLFGGVTSAAFGTSISYAKKLNNDNFADIVIGAPAYKNTLAGEGAVFVYYGSSTGPTASPLIAYGGQTSAALGTEVKSAGDLDLDGYNDIAVSANMFDNGQTNEGAVYVYMGSAAGVSLTNSWKTEGNLASAQYGKSIAGDADFNGDGFGDLVISAPAYNLTTTADGALFTFYGSSF